MQQRSDCLCAQWGGGGGDLNLMENQNSRPVALHLAKQDIKKSVPAAGELGVEGVDSSQTSPLHLLYILPPVPHPSARVHVSKVNER